MNVSQALSVSKYISDGVEKSSAEMTKIAIGGYPALVAQGILKESRETKDIDLCAFVPKVEGRRYPGEYVKDAIRHLFYVNTDGIRRISQAAKVRQEPKTAFAVISTDQTYSKRKSNDNNDQDAELSKIGINSSFGVVVLDETIKKEKKEPIKKSALDEATRELRESILSGASWVTYGITTSSTTSSTSLKNMQYYQQIAVFPLSEILLHRPLLPSHDDMKKPETDLRSLQDSWIAWADFLGDLLTAWMHVNGPSHVGYTEAINGINSLTSECDSIRNLIGDAIKEKKDGFSMSIYSLLMRDHDYIADCIRKFCEGELFIDVFTLYQEDLNKYSIEINGDRYVHYYLILRAKLEYCKNKNTDEVSFKKHIDDLVESYKVKRILGVNDPKTIEELINARPK